MRRIHVLLIGCVVAVAAALSAAAVHHSLPSSWLCGANESGGECLRQWIGAFGGWAVLLAAYPVLLQVREARRSAAAVISPVVERRIETIVKVRLEVMPMFSTMNGAIYWTDSIIGRDNSEAAQFTEREVAEADKYIAMIPFSSFLFGEHFFKTTSAALAEFPELGIPAMEAETTLSTCHIRLKKLRDTLAAGKDLDRTKPDQYNSWYEQVREQAAVLRGKLMESKLAVTKLLDAAYATHIRLYKSRVQMNADLG